MTKVVHVTTAHPALDNRIFFKECRSLAQAGYQVVLIACHARDDVVDGVRIRALPAPRGRLDRMLRLSRVALAYCREEDADLCHLHDPELLPHARALRRLGCGVIYDMHENVPRSLAYSKPYLPKWVAPAVGRFYSWLERCWLAGTSVVFAEASYKESYPWIKRHVDVLNMPDIREVLPVAAEKRATPTIGYFGLVAGLRGSWDTLKAVIILRAQGLHVDFECIGPAEAEHAAELHDYITKHGLAGVRLHGYMVAPKAYRAMTSWHIGLAVLHPTPNMRDSLSTKMFEYMALGLPVIVSDFPLYRDLVERIGCGLCVRPADEKALAEAIRRIIEDPEEARIMGERGRRAVQDRYSWEREEQKLLGFYEQILAVK